MSKLRTLVFLEVFLSTLSQVVDNVIRRTKDNQHKLMIVTVSLNFVHFYLSTINV